MGASKNLLETLYAKLRSAISNKNWTKSEELINNCFRRYGSEAKPHWYHDLYLIKRKLGKDSEVELICDEAIKNFPMNSIGYYCRAENAFLNNDWVLSARLWSDLINRFPELTHPAWRSNLCLSLFNIGSLDLENNAKKFLMIFQISKT